MYLFWFTYVPQRKTVIHVAFPNSWLEDGFAYFNTCQSAKETAVVLVCAHRARYREFAGRPFH